MTFKVVDTKTGKEPTYRVIYNIAKKGGIMTMDIDQFFVGEDGELVLADDCGNIMYCDTKRFKVVAESLEQEPCGDCISLEAVKNTMFMVQRTAFISDNEFLRTMDLLMRLPPVTPAEKVGHWIYVGNSEVNGLKICKCSNCEKKTYGSHKFCPNCGAKMEVEQNGR